MSSFPIRDVTGHKLTEEDIEYSSKRAPEGGERVGRFIVDANTKKAYAIPENVDHDDFVARLLGTTVDALKKEPMKYNYFVAVSIKVQNGWITEMLIGISGFEVVMATAEKRSRKPPIKGPLRYHTIEQLQETRRITYDFIIDAPIPLAKNFKEHFVEVI